MSAEMDTLTGCYTVTCDKCSLKAVMEFTREQKYPYKKAVQFDAGLAQLGWTFYSSRSLHTYCRDCKPSRGHHMTDITELIARRRV